MPKKTVAIDYQACEPKNCDDGVCKAAQICEKKLLNQLEPYELPDIKAPSLCLSCARCVVVCPNNAVRVL